MAPSIARARELAAKYGARFEPPASFVDRPDRGERYSNERLTAAV